MIKILAKLITATLLNFILFFPLLIFCCRHMKIDEPKTPYHTYSDSEDDSDGKSSRPRRVSLLGAVDPIKLAEGLEASTSQPPVYADDNYSDDEELTPEQIGQILFV